MSTNDTSNPKLSIGMAIYNGEQFIKKRLDSILSQSFKDFELIITDDSTDTTPVICQEYAKKDNRICYFHNKERMGWVKSYISVVNKARGDYFVWAPVDDIWNKTFLEKNIQVLESDNNVVGSISKVELYGKNTEQFRSTSKDSFLIRIYKKFRSSFRPFGVYPLYGSYERRAGKCLRNMSPASLYSVFRTDQLRKSINHEPVGSWDFITVLSVLEFGNLHVVEEVLLQYYTGGISSHGVIYSYKHKQIRFLEILFPFSYLIKWCLDHFGLQFFIKNLDHFIWLNCYGLVGFTVELVRLIKNRHTE